MSEIAKIYDPLGLLGPVVLYAKQLIQEMWRDQIHWDESVTQNVQSRWSEFSQQFESINEISFDRKLFIEGYHSFQIHGFCDASNVGYGACLYVRSVNKNNESVCKILCAKSRVSPLKTVTIPRLELCGALLLARLYRETYAALNAVPAKVIFWCDSTIVLHWLNTPPHRLKTYVANRVVEIRENTESHAWRHIRSDDNPADALSRGQLPYAFLKNKIWRSGSTWLTNNEDDWLKQLMQTIEIPELKQNICLVSTVTDYSILERYSSHSKLCRVVARCLRLRLNNAYHGPLCPKEIDEVEIRVIKLLQASQLLDELKKLNGKQPYRGKLVNLSPFIDENGVLRVGGRLQSSRLTFSQKHPMLLPNRNSVTDRIIRETHERNFHTGIQNTLYQLRRKYWLTDGKNQVRKIIRTCVRCSRFEAQTTNYKMGNLPAHRICETIPFTNTGMDFCGLLYMKEKKYRNRIKIKAYVCVFVCMTIKAVHLEVISDLTTEGFLAALRRFVARRGLPKTIYSDNGTNFVGANNKLKELYALFNSNEHTELINQYSNNHHITWHFIPPNAPHFGGLWESTVKLFKHHFKRVVGDSLFTFEELNTFTIEIEGILNSRPLTSLSSDPNDLHALTPAHYLIGRPLTAPPERELQSVPANHLSTWQHITKVRQDFWARWHLEYLNELQKRAKWNKDVPNLTVGTIALIKERNLPCTQWAIGKITKLHPGADGVARAADLKTSKGEIRRAIKSLCPIPVEH